MKDQREKNNSPPWLSVPQFGDWDQKDKMPDYSLDFSKIRENRKQNKKDMITIASFENEEEILSRPKTKYNSNKHHHHHHLDHHHHHTLPPTAKRGIFSCFNCCIKA